MKYDDQQETKKSLDAIDEIIESLNNRGYKSRALRGNNSRSIIEPPELAQLPESWRMEIKRLTERRPIKDRYFDYWKIHMMAREIQDDSECQPQN